MTRIVALLVGSLALAIFGLHGALASGGAALGHFLADSTRNMAGPTLFAFVAGVFVLEQFRPAVRRRLLCRAHLVDASYLLLFAVCVAPLLSLVQLGLGTFFERDASFLVLTHLGVLPQIAVSAVILVGMDACNWLAHYLNHRSKTLWRLHALHHSQEEMGVFTTFRTHPLIHAVYLVSMLPALVLAGNGRVPGMALILYGCLIALPHANLDWGFGPLGRIVVSPAYHRLHHSRVPVAAREPGGVNLGFVLVCWDRLAGRAAFPDATAVVRSALPLGLPQRPVPVEQDAAPGARHFVRIVCAQLAQPFRRDPFEPAQIAVTEKKDGLPVTLLRTVVETLRRTREALATRDAVLLVARLVLAWVFVYHGAGTLFGAFHDGGLHTQEQFFATRAHLHPAMFFAVMNGLIEFGGGIAIGLGFFSRLFAIGIIGDMTMAIITVTGGEGVAASAAGSGYELNLALGGLALLVALCGSGRLSFEPLLQRWGKRIFPPAPVP